MKKLIFLIIPILLFSKAVKIDEVLTEAKKFKLDTTIGYSNINKSQNGYAPIMYQTLNGDFVTIPTYLGKSKSNQNFATLGLSLKYGYSKTLEFYTSITGYNSNTNISSGDSFTTSHDKDWSSLSLGFTYQYKKEDNYPAIIIGASSNVLDRTRFDDTNSSDMITKDISLKGYSFFLSSLYTVDPIVFSLKLNYGLNLTKKYKGKSINNGEIISFTPQIFFAVNPYTSLNWGVQYLYRGKDRVDDKIVSNKSSSVGLLFGTTYEINNKFMLSIDTKFTSGVDYTSSDLNTNLTYKF